MSLFYPQLFDTAIEPIYECWLWKAHMCSIASDRKILSVPAYQLLFIVIIKILFLSSLSLSMTLFSIWYC